MESLQIIKQDSCQGYMMDEFLMTIGRIVIHLTKLYLTSGMVELVSGTVCLSTVLLYVSTQFLHTWNYGNPMIKS